MAQTTFFPPAEIPEVQPGDVFLLGERHRLMCGDATDKGAVAQLFGGNAPTLVITSPPYAKQRAYDRPIPCWDSMMMGALNGHNFAASVQMLINLGVVHVDGDFSFYWLKWVMDMKASGWKLSSQLIWDKISAIPGANIGRARPCHEFVFHFSKNRSLMNYTETCKWAGTVHHGHNFRGKDNRIKRRGSPHTVIKSHRIMDSVIRLHPEKRRTNGHPAVFPTSLPQKMIAGWKKEGCVAYDPFSGSGTTILAAELEDTTGLAMEISPAYCQIALRRWAKEHPDKPIRKI